MFLRTAGRKQKLFWAMFCDKAQWDNILFDKQISDVWRKMFGRLARAWEIRKLSYFISYIDIPLLLLPWWHSQTNFIHYLSSRLDRSLKILINHLTLNWYNTLDLKFKKGLQRGRSFRDSIENCLLFIKKVSNCLVRHPSSFCLQFSQIIDEKIFANF